MTFTDSGNKVKKDWIPLAMANGVEWSIERKGFADRFNNLYRFGYTPISWLLWYVGALIGKYFYSPVIKETQLFTK